MIYILTTGTYSDYHIIAAFSSKEKAQAAIEWSGGSSSDYNIEEYEVDLPTPQDNRFPWYIEIKASNGDILMINRCDRGPVGTAENYKQTNAMDYTPYKQDRIVVGCWADSEELAKKIATEKRQELLAQKALLNSKA